MSALQTLLITAVGVMWACGTALAQGIASRTAPAAPRPAPSGKPWTARFVDIAAPAGLDMRFSYGGESVKKYIVEANGSGVALLDYDNDGRLDAFLVNGSRFGEPTSRREGNRLYRNTGNWKFADVTAAAGLEHSGLGNGVCTGDYDNDGFDDLFVTYWGASVLYRNTGKGRFEEATAQAGVAGPVKAWRTGCTFVDYDRDGLLDLFTASYAGFDPARVGLPGSAANCLWKGMPVFCGPRGLPHGTAWLYHNRGDGTFEDASEKSGARAAAPCYAFTTIAADLNDDGWTDIYVACDSTPSLLFRNNRNGTFTDVGIESGVAYNEHGHEQGGMGTHAGDFDGDGRVDLIKTNFSGDYPNLFRGLGGGSFEDVVVKGGLAVNPEYVGWGVAFADLDNDGLSDVFQVNGHVFPDIERLKGAERYRNPRLVYRNLGGGRFEDVSALSGPGIAELKSSRGAALADLDGDGDLDALIMNMGEAPSLLRNDLGGGKRWIEVALEGRRSNRSAIGAVVRIEAGGRTQTAPVLSQSSFLSDSGRRLHFGLGAAERIDSVHVRWPSGMTESFTASSCCRVLKLVEGAGTPP